MLSLMMMLMITRITTTLNHIHGHQCAASSSSEALSHGNHLIFCLNFSFEEAFCTCCPIGHGGGSTPAVQNVSLPCFANVVCFYFSLWPCSSAGSLKHKIETLTVNLRSSIVCWHFGAGTPFGFRVCHCFGSEKSRCRGCPFPRARCSLTLVELSWVPGVAESTFPFWGFGNSCSDTLGHVRKFSMVPGPRLCFPTYQAASGPCLWN